MELLVRKAWIPTPTLSYCFASVLIFLFSYAVYSKLSNYELSKKEMLAQVFPDYIALQLAWLVPLAEIITTLLLLFQPTQLIGFYASAFLLLSFSIYIALGIRGAFNEIPCPCAGILKRMKYREHLLFNIVFLVIALFGIEVNEDWIGLFPA